MKTLERLEKRKTQSLENIGRKIRKEYRRKTRKLLKTKLYSRNLIKDINTSKILGTILKIDMGGTQTNKQKGKKVDDYAQGLTSDR